MKASVLMGLLRQGKKPVVRLTGGLWDDSFGDKGMIARVVSATEEKHEKYPDTVELGFDFNEHREHNLALDEPCWHIGGTSRTGTAIEAGHFKDGNIHEGVHFEMDQEVAAELLDENTPLSEYVASGSGKSYVEWLEAKLDELVPECMKTWKKGL
jgi:hypothetical protein